MASKHTLRLQSNFHAISTACPASAFLTSSLNDHSLSPLFTLFQLHWPPCCLGWYTNHVLVAWNAVTPYLIHSGLFSKTSFEGSFSWPPKNQFHIPRFWEFKMHSSSNFLTSQTIDYALHMFVSLTPSVKRRTCKVLNQCWMNEHILLLQRKSSDFSLCPQGWCETGLLKVIVKHFTIVGHQSHAW